MKKKIINLTKEIRKRSEAQKNRQKLLHVLFWIKYLMTLKSQKHWLRVVICQKFLKKVKTR